MGGQNPRGGKPVKQCRRRIRSKIDGYIFSALNTEGREMKLKFWCELRTQRRHCWKTCGRAILPVAVFVLIASMPVRSNADGEMESPAVYLALPAVVLGFADFILVLGNVNDILNDEASRVRGVLGVVFGSATILTAAGIAAGTDSSTTAAITGALGGATVVSGIWAIKAVNQEHSLSVGPDYSHGKIALAITCAF